MSSRCLEIIGARTHNLKGIDARIPHGSLTVITGVSGSGKSSLAFDTLYAEGQRRYVESLSTYARQFIEKMARPPVDAVRNIQPAIAIEQKNSVKNARSTIGTATEIADYLRLLFAKAGVTICPDCGIDVREDTPQSVAADLLARHAGERMCIVSPLPGHEKPGIEALRAELLRAGFSRIFVPQRMHAPVGGAGARPFIDLDNATPDDLRDALGGGAVRILIDRVAASDTDYERMASGIALAMQAGRGTVEIWSTDSYAPEPECLTYHSGFRCNQCGRSFPRPEPKLFSFNSPLGACPKCQGFGRAITIDWDKVIPDRSLTLAGRPIAAFNSPMYKKCYQWMRKTIDPAEIPWNKPLNKFTKKEWNSLLYGAGKFEGVREFFNWLEKERYKVQSRIMLARYRGFVTCPDCAGTRLVPEALNVFWAPASGVLPRRAITDISRMSIRDLLADVVAVTLTPAEENLYGRIFREIQGRLTYLARVGLGYLTLDRQTRTLSGGEAQRINLSTALGTALTQTLYVLDEPTVGLHARDTLRLLDILRDLRGKGNTIVVVEHDPEIILGADMLIDLGPAAGSRGGEIVFSGPPDALAHNGANSLTAKYLMLSPDTAAKPSASATARFKSKPSELRIIGARAHNLKNVTVQIPLHQLVCVTGVSGSGKTTLVHDVLYQNFNQSKGCAAEDLGICDGIEGFEGLDEILLVDQSPIGRSARSNPVTYVKAYDHIRKLFAATREARARGLAEGAFSFNVAGGRCETCKGSGVVTYDMHFLADLTLPCEICGGRRFQPRVLEVRCRGKNIDDILAMTLDDACVFFASEMAITRRLAPLREVGLGYLALGQNTSTLSGGEAQRLKLASSLSAAAAGAKTLMIFDEPTTGLHMADLDTLLKVFRRLIDRGYSLIVIEHNLEVIRQADWIIDLGPEGGEDGGFLVAQGPPAAIIAEPRSHTGRFLRGARIHGEHGQPRTKNAAARR
ncbi:MAG: excinuclease ABC subunit UvrA [Candidatus Sumerlaeota bacterium]|nr:excinuclease ABC subunit UvrA [Candidatus Sumerlaeota bacterium]